MAKKYTQAEWARIQARLPQEDREPYSSSPDIVDTSTKATIDPYYVRDPKTGLSPAQVEANKAVAEAAAAAGMQVTPGATGPKATASRVSTTPVTSKTPTPTTGGTPTGPSGTPTGPTGAGGGGKKLVSTYKDPVTGDIIAVYDDGSKTVLTPGNLAGEKQRAGQSAFDLLKSQFAQYGLGGLVDSVGQYIKDGLSADELLLRLRDSEPYKKRFAANAQRVAKGLRALSEAEYIGLEDQYQNVMRNYGLPESYYTKGDMGVQPGFEKFLAGDVSAAELEDRIQTAQNRVLYANPEVSQALKQFYPDITNGDILAYALDPQQALTNIKRKVTAAEIGAGALVAGLQTDLAKAEALRGYGVTGEQAKQGYQTIAGVLPRASTLADIYAKQGMGPYTQTTAEAEVFGLPAAAEATTKRKKLTELEQAQFGGSSGRAQGALARERAGQF